MENKYCDICTESTNKVVFIDNKPICQNCVNEYFEWCDYCQKYHEKDEVSICSFCGKKTCIHNYKIDDFDNILCPYCWENSYICIICEKRISRNETYYYCGYP